MLVKNPPGAAAQWQVEKLTLCKLLCSIFCIFDIMLFVNPKEERGNTKENHSRTYHNWYLLSPNHSAVVHK